MRELTRRRFLQSVIGGTSAVLLAACSVKTGEGGDSNSLTKGEGAIVDIDGKQVAIYKGEDRQTSQLSPICPHAGCIVQWNASGKTWDCPCHGSIFQPDGKRISGPAGKDLEKLG